jgi:hypothetical protein
MDNLNAIARQAMIEHDLLPDFSPEAQRQADSITGPDSKTRPAIRDLRALLWRSDDLADPKGQRLTEIIKCVQFSSAIDAQLSTGVDSRVTARMNWLSAQRKRSTSSIRLSRAGYIDRR